MLLRLFVMEMQGYRYKEYLKNCSSSLISKFFNCIFLISKKKKKKIKVMKKKPFFGKKMNLTLECDDKEEDDFLQSNYTKLYIY